MWKPIELDARQMGDTEQMTPAVFEHKTRITWGDCDPDRIAYTGRLPWFALDAIDAWWETHLGDAGWFHLNVDRNIGTPFVHMSIDFSSPVTPRHRLICKVRPMKLGETSIEFSVDGYQGGVLCFKGRFVKWFIVSDEFKKQKVPADIRAFVEPLLPILSA